MKLVTYVNGKFPTVEAAYAAVAQEANRVKMMRFPVNCEIVAWTDDVSTTIKVRVDGKPPAGFEWDTSK